MSKKDDDENRSYQLNPEHDAYWQSRGYDERPDDEDEEWFFQGAYGSLLLIASL